MREFDPERDCSMCGEDKLGFEFCQDPMCEESEDYEDPDAESYSDSPYDTAIKILGYCGQMLSGSKRARPGQNIVWNGNICTKSHGKIWFGDIDLNASADKLHELATELGEKVYVLREHDARFKNEAAPLFNEAVEVFEEEAI